MSTTHTAGTTPTLTRKVTGLQALEGRRRLAVTGGSNTLTAGNFTFKVTETTATPLNPALSYTWTVATTQGAPTLGTVAFDFSSATNFQNYGGTFSLDVSGTTVYLNASPVPEPAILGFVVVSALLMYRRRNVM